MVCNVSGRSVLRRLLLLAMATLAACAAPAPSAPERSALAPAPVPPVRLREPLVDIRHYDIRVDIDHRAGMVDGTVSVVFAALPDRPATHLQLDAVELILRGAWDAAGKELGWTLKDHVLDIVLREPLPPGAETSVTIEYRCWPRRGLYVVGPSAAEPGRPWHLWTQGETHETRHWLPVWDQPDDRATHTLAVTVDDRFITLAAGERLASRHGEGTGRRTDTWSLDVPHPSYLITLVAGELGVEELPGTTTLLPVVADPAVLPAAQQGLARTDDMLAMLAAFSGRTYPWPKYAQCLVRDFVAGGQENISATTLTHETLHAAQDGPQEDLRTEDLLVHEAAHQWFGDLLTCDDWSHLWLNEGFATYADLLWARRTRGEDAARAMALSWQRQMVDEERSAGHPIVWPDYPDPDALFDTHSYEGAATRLHLLAAVLGDAAFRAGVQRYVRAHEASNVTTPDLRAALESGPDATDLSGFFAEWIDGRGFPAFVAEAVTGGGAPRLVVRQVQGADGGRAVFHLPVHVAWSRGGREHEALLPVDEALEELELAGDGTLDWARFDSRTVVPGSIAMPQDEAAWCSQLAHASDGVTRLVAAQWFALDPYVVAADAGRPALQPDSLLALDARARTDGFVPVRTTALAALAARAPEGHGPTLALLLDLSRDEDARVRAVAAQGLADRGGDEALATLLELAEDPNGEVAAAAVDALVTRGEPGAFAVGRRLYDEADPLRWRLRAALLVALARLPDEPRVAPLLVAAARSDRTPAVRATALLLLRGRADPPPDVTFRLCGEALWDVSHHVRAAAAQALADWPASLSSPLLLARLRIESDPEVLSALEAALAEPD